VKLRLAPQFWVHTERDFAASQAPSIFSALVSMVTAAIGGEKSSMADMTGPLDRIEALLPGENKVSHRTPLIATYALWQLIVPPELRRPDRKKLLEEFSPLLNEPSIYSAVVAVLTGNRIPWEDAELAALVDAREKSLEGGGGSTLELPPRLDAAFQIELARRAFAAGDQGGAEARIAKAVELLPGDGVLMQLEEDLRSGILEAFTLHDFIADRRSERGDETV
jgi:hypothetical protein